MTTVIGPDGGSSNVHIAGTGEPVVLVHCSGSSHRAWRRLAEELSGTHRVFAPDLYANGDSGPWPGRRAITLSGEAAPIRRLIEDQDTPVHLVGHSYGGAVALRLARELPNRLRSLTLLEPSAFHLLTGPSPALRAARREIGAMADAAATALVRGDWHAGMAAFVDYWTEPGSWAAMDEESRARLATRLPKVVLDFHAIFAERMPRGAFAHLRVPTLVVRGERSPAPARTTAALVARLVPGARLREVSAAGHMLPLTHPQAVNPMIHAHIARHGGHAATSLAA